MAKLKIDQHPTVKAIREKQQAETTGPKPLNAAWLRQLAIDCGADDAGLVEIERPDLDNERPEILGRYPWTKTLLAFVRRMSREPVKSEARSVANLEFHHKGEEVNHISGKIVERLEEHGVRAVNPSMGFPMEMARFPNRIWIVSHKPVAVAAGLGHMGIHRNVIHPKFGNFVLLGTVLLDMEATEYDQPIDYNPCLECNLCVAVCPVGAISPDGEKFNFTSCFTHNYREFMGGFNDWIEQIVDSKTPLEYRRRINESETSSFWQSLSFGPNYKSAYCMAVCPAGEEVIGPYLNDKKSHLQEVVKPLQRKEETVFVVPGSDAEVHVKKRFENKQPKHVGNALHPRSIEGFLDALSYVFQWNQAAGFDATYHFTFTGREQRQATVIIADQKISVEEGHVGEPNLRVTADSQTWLGFLAGERSLVWALITRRIRLKGSPRLLIKFGKCFPSAGTKHRPVEDWREPALTKSTRPIFLRNESDTGKIAHVGSTGRKWSGALSVAEIIRETPNVKTFRMVDPRGGDVPLAYLPGQFLTLEVSPHGKRIKRSYTIASTPSRRECLEITVKREAHGLVSRYLHDEVKVGDLLKLTAPSGSFTFTGEGHDSIVLVAAGVGITPIMSVLRFLCDHQWSGEIFVLLGFRTQSEFIFREEIQQLAAQRTNLHVHITMSRPADEPWTGRLGRIDKEFIAECVPDIASRLVHICGPIPMMDATKQAMLDLGVPLEKIKSEAFGTAKRRPTQDGDTASDAPRIKVSFKRSGKTIEIPAHQTVLEGADLCGVEIDNACRSGTCGSCKVRLLTGAVHMDCEDALEKDEKASGIILACQSVSQSDVEVDV